jgi:hypothetical protein
LQRLSVCAYERLFGHRFKATPPHLTDVVDPWSRNCSRRSSFLIKCERRLRHTMFPFVTSTTDGGWSSQDASRE